MKFVILAQILKSCLDISTHPMILFLTVTRILIQTYVLCLYAIFAMKSIQREIKVGDTEHLADDFIINDTVF